MPKITFEFDTFDQAEYFMIHSSAFFRNENTSGNDKTEPKTEAPAEVPKEEKPTARKRGRPAKSAETETKPPGRRTRQAAKEEEPASPSSPEEADISDADASKAASEAARDLTVEVVLEELDKFKVKKVAELTQPQRREFLQILRGLLNNGRL